MCYVMLIICHNTETSNIPSRYIFNSVPLNLPGYEPYLTVNHFISYKMAMCIVTCSGSYKLKFPYKELLICFILGFMDKKQ